MAQSATVVPVEMAVVGKDTGTPSFAREVRVYNTMRKDVDVTVVYENPETRKEFSVTVKIVSKKDYVFPQKVVTIKKSSGELFEATAPVKRVEVRHLFHAHKLVPKVSGIVWRVGVKLFGRFVPNLRQEVVDANGDVAPAKLQEENVDTEPQDKPDSDDGPVQGNTPAHDHDHDPTSKPGEGSDSAAKPADVINPVGTPKPVTSVIVHNTTQKPQTVTVTYASQDSEGNYKLTVESFAVPAGGEHLFDEIRGDKGSELVKEVKVAEGKYKHALTPKDQLLPLLHVYIVDVDTKPELKLQTPDSLDQGTKPADGAQIDQSSKPGGPSAGGEAAGATGGAIGGGATDGVTAGGATDGAASGGATDGAASGGPTDGATSACPAEGAASGGATDGATAGGVTDGAAAGGVTDGAATGGATADGGATAGGEGGAVSEEVSDGDAGGAASGGVDAGEAAAVVEPVVVASPFDAPIWGAWKAWDKYVAIVADPTDIRKFTGYFADGSSPNFSGEYVGQGTWSINFSDAAKLIPELGRSATIKLINDNQHLTFINASGKVFNGKNGWNLVAGDAESLKGAPSKAQANADGSEILGMWHSGQITVLRDPKDNRKFVGYCTHWKALFTYLGNGGWYIMQNSSDSNFNPAGLSRITSDFSTLEHWNNRGAFYTGNDAWARSLIPRVVALPEDAGTPFEAPLWGIWQAAEKFVAIVADTSDVGKVVGVFPDGSRPNFTGQYQGEGEWSLTFPDADKVNPAFAPSVTAKLVKNNRQLVLTDSKGTVYSGKDGWNLIMSDARSLRGGPSKVSANADGSALIGLWNGNFTISKDASGPNKYVGKTSQFTYLGNGGVYSFYNPKDVHFRPAGLARLNDTLTRVEHWGSDSAYWGGSGYAWLRTGALPANIPAVKPL